MRFVSILVSILTIATGPMAAFGQACPGGPGCGGWSDSFRAEGVAGPKRVVLTEFGEIYAYGRPMLSTGGQVWNGVLKWNGANWDNVGEFDGWIAGLYPGNGSEIYAVGDFSRAGSVASRRVARWNGFEWKPLGAGFADPPLAFAVSPDGTVNIGGGTRTGGPFRTPLVYRSTVGLKSWNGTGWTSRGNSAGAYVGKMAIAPDGTVYASIGDGTLCLARLPVNATQFECMGGAREGGSMAVDGRGYLYVAERGRLQLWTDGQLVGSVLEGVQHVYGRGGQVWATTLQNDSLRVRHLMGDSWAAVGPAFWGSVSDVSASPGQGVVIAGTLRLNNASPIETAVHLVGSDWRPLRDSTPRLGLPDRVRAVHAMATGGAVVASQVGFSRDRSSHIAVFEAGEWSTLGETFDDEVLVVFGDDSSEIFASGIFHRSGDTELPGLARWDGTRWHPMGELPFPPGPFAVRAFARDVEGRLIAVGSDQWDAGTGFVIRWNDPGWTVLTRIDGPVSSVVAAPDGSLVIGGGFDSAGLHHIARLDGSELIAMGEGFEGTAAGLVVHQGSVVALDNVGSLVSGNRSQTKRWNGSSWDAMDAGFTGGGNQARYLGVDREQRLFAAGSFRWAGLADAHGIAQWKDERWQAVPGVSGEMGRADNYLGGTPEYWALSSGPNLAVAHDGTLYLGLGSELVYTGGSVASNFTVWYPDGPPSSITPDPIKPPETPVVQYTVYPNPTTGTVRIAGQPSPDRISVFDALGRQLGQYRYGLSALERTLHLPVLTPGVYFLVLDLGDRRQTLPILVR